MNNDGKSDWGGHPRAEAFFIIGLAITAVLAMSDFTILGQDFGTDSWKSQYPWANHYSLEQVRTVNYDTVMEHRPWFEFARTEMLAGRLPLWNPYSFTGAPLYANHLCPVLYPPLTFALLVFNGDDIAGWLAVIHLAIFGIALYAFLRMIGIKSWPAFLTAAAAQFTGVCLSMWHPWAAVVAWAPAILAFYEGYRQTRNPRNLAWGALIYGLMSMAAFPVIAVHFTYFLLLYIIIREVSGPGRKPVSILPAFLAIVVLGIVISGVQNIPTLIYSADTYRSAKYEHSLAYLDELPPPEAVEPERPDLPAAERAILSKGRFVTPVAQLRLIENRHYIGAPILLFGIMGLFLLPAGRRHWFYIFIIFFAISFVDPLYMWLMKILPLWKIREYQPREMWQLSCLVCAGYGLQGLLDGRAAALKAAFKVLLIIFALALTGFVATVLLIEGKIAAEMFPIDAGWFTGVGLLYLIALSIIVIVILSCLFGVWSRPGYHIAIFLAAIVLGGIPSRMLALPYTSDVPAFTPDAGDFIRVIEKATGGDNRVARLISREYHLNFYRRMKVPFLANITTRYNLRDISGYDSLISMRTVDYMNLIEEKSIKSLRAHVSFTDPGVLSKDLFRAMAIGCIISDIPDLPINGPVKQFGDIFIYSVDNPSPRYYLAKKALILDTPDAAKPHLLHNGWLNAREVYIDGSNLPDEDKNKIGAIDAGAVETGTIVLNDETPSMVRFTVNVVSPGLMVFNDAYAPGWNVHIDGVRTRCLNANLLFRAAYVPRGKHEVVFSYEPAYMAYGWLSTGIGLVVIIIILLGGAYPGRRGFRGKS